MSDDLPPHVGRLTDPETGCALVCTHTHGGIHGPICGMPATWHILWTADSGCGMACDEHLPEAEALSPLRMHAIEGGGACGIAGALWLPHENRCVLDTLSGEPARREKAEEAR